MNAKDPIVELMNRSEAVLHLYVDDLTDSEFNEIAVTGMNSIAWQVGHLLSTEHLVIEAIRPGSSPPLPDGFNERHMRNSPQASSTGGWLSKDEYFKLRDAQRAVTLKVVEELPIEELDNPAVEMLRPMFPTVGSSLLLIGSHTLLHLGQFVVVRRKNNKPIAL